VLCRANDAIVVLVRGTTEVASWPLENDRGPHCDLHLVEELARLQLTAQRLGYAIRLRQAPPDLRALLDLCGLADVVPDIDDPGR
jgi:hypothetical protein